MTLDEFCSRNKKRDVDLAKATGIHASRINRFRRREAMPSWESMEAIARATGYAVLPNDFANFLPPTPADPLIPAAAE